MYFPRLLNYMYTLLSAKCSHHYGDSFCFLSPQSPISTIIIIIIIIVILIIIVIIKKPTNTQTQKNTPLYQTLETIPASLLHSFLASQ